IARGDLQAAVQFCEDPRNYSLATDVVLAGLERFQSSEFGFADYKSAVEEAGGRTTRPARVARERRAKTTRRGSIARPTGLTSSVSSPPCSACLAPFRE